MKLNMRKAISFILTLMLVVSVMPTTFAIGASDTVEINRMNSGVVIDDDATGGYEGDYVVIYNPGTSTSSSVSTGTLTGLIETSVGTSAQMKGASKIDADRPYIIDVDGEFGYEDITKIRDNPVKASYPVGTTKNFSITNYSPGGSSVQFKVLYVGEHCRIWTVTNESYYPLDTMNESYAETVAAEFDKNFTRMSDSFGAFRDSNSDGKVNLMFYNIDDGWQPGQGYVAGYFWSGDFSYNSLPMIHIDTYPGIQYTTTSGETREDVTSCYGTFMHEFQHLINYSVTGGMDTWLNESFSGATEEMFYPGVGLFNRIQSWHNSHFSAVADISNVASEFEYNSSYNLHKGGSIYAWDNNGDDIYARYAIVMLFSQYLYTQTGGTTVYKTIMNSVKNGSSCTTAVANAMGTTIANVAKGFFTSMIANDGGENGFIMQPGYDPTTVYNVENVYDLLAPVVFTGTSASIYGGGFITVKPVNGVFNPPSGASSTLKYVGIKLNNEPVAVTAISIPDTAEVAEGAAASIALTVNPSNANDYTTAWSSDNTAIATVDSNGKVTGIATGTTTITCTVTDNVLGSTFTDTCTVTVTAFEGYLVADQFEDGGEYIIVASDAYAVSNNTVGTTGYYLSPVSVTISGNECRVASTVNVNEILWKAEGNTTDGFTLKSLDDGNYMTLNSSQYLYPGTNAITWKYDGTDLANSADSEGYYYLSYSSSTTARFTTGKNTGNSIKIYKKITSSAPVETYYTVTFKDWDGTVLSTQSVLEGTAATAPAAPMREGYTFTGWDKAFDNVTADMTVTAQYTINTYTVTFVDHDGTALDTQTVNYGEAATAPAAPAREGYHFVAWDVAFDNITADTTVTAQYTAAPIIKMLGASYRTTPNKGIRFGGQLDKNFDTNYITITKIGMLIIPENVLNGAELTVDTSKVLNVNITSFITNNDEMYQFVATLTNLSGSLLDRRIAARAYVEYTFNGEVYRLYSDTVIRSYNELAQQ